MDVFEVLERPQISSVLRVPTLVDHWALLRLGAGNNRTLCDDVDLLDRHHAADEIGCFRHLVAHHQTYTVNAGGGAGAWAAAGPE